jgi:hypothetical protein
MVGRPKIIASAACQPLEYCRSFSVSGKEGAGVPTSAQNVFSRSTRVSGALPAMIAEVIAPADAPITQSGIILCIERSSKAPAR